MKNQTCFLLLFVSVLIVAGCGKPEERAVEGPKFDPKYIAAEADKGNLGPLKELNAACSSEVEKSGKRGSACDKQDHVGGLRKPMKLSF